MPPPASQSSAKSPIIGKSLILRSCYIAVHRRRIFMARSTLAADDPVKFGVQLSIAPPKTAGVYEEVGSHPVSRQSRSAEDRPKAN